MPLYRRASCIIIAICLVLSACSTPQSQPDSEAPLEDLTAQQWLEQASQAEEPLRSSYQFYAARQMYADGNVSAAATLSAGLDAGQLADADLSGYLLLKAQLIDLQDSPAAAANWLSAAKQTEVLDSLAPAQQLPVYSLLAQLQGMAGYYLQSVATRVYIDPIIEDEALKIENQDSTWQALMNVPPADIHTQLEGELKLSGDTRGWFELAIIAMESQGDIEQQLSRLERWEKRWSRHPAALRLPGGMELLRELALNKPTELAVLLPLSGRLKQAGFALRDGIVAAHFDARQAGATVPTLSFYDSSAGTSITDLYWEAVTNGAEMIIGPLDKVKVRELNQSNELPVPVLALNYSDTANAEGNPLVQFGLSSNDEAELIVQRALQLGYKRTMVIHSNDAWSTRTANYFSELWAENQGETPTTVVFTDDRSLSNNIKKGLQIQLSQQRARALANVSGEQLEFTPRRREDIDFVFIPVNARLARSIKPLLAFHFAEELPVMATSRIYTGKPNPRRDSDLNNILFTDTPWVLDTDNAHYGAVSDYVKRGGAASKNLYALGIDAYQMAPRLPQLANSLYARFFGHTGTLQLNSDNKVVRKPQWAVFVKGYARPLVTDNSSGKEASNDKQHGAEKTARR